MFLYPVSTVAQLLPIFLMVCKYYCQLSAHRNGSLSSVEKLSYLGSKLDVNATITISGLTLTDENYEVAIKIFHERFGDLPTIFNAHHWWFIELPVATFQTESLISLYNEIEKLLRSVKASSREIFSHNIFISIITSKPLKPVSINFKKEKGRNKERNVCRLRENQEGYITAKESAEHI